MTRTPPRIQTMATTPECGNNAAMAAGFLKTPEPRMVPRTMAVAVTGPSTRARPGAAVEVDWLMRSSVRAGWGVDRENRYRRGPAVNAFGGIAWPFTAR